MPSFKFNNKIGKFNELILKQYEGDESRHYKAKLNISQQNFNLQHDNLKKELKMNPSFESNSKKSKVKTRVLCSIDKTKSLFHKKSYSVHEAIKNNFESNRRDKPDLPKILIQQTTNPIEYKATNECQNCANMKEIQSYCSKLEKEITNLKLTIKIMENK